MHIETSADARRSRRHVASGGLAGPAADDRGYLAAAASRFSSWWSGERRSPALTADADSGAGLQGGTTDSDPPSNGDAAPAPPEGGEPPSQSNQDSFFLPPSHTFRDYYQGLVLECKSLTASTLHVLCITHSHVARVPNHEHSQ